VASSKRVDPWSPAAGLSLARWAPMAEASEIISPVEVLMKGVERAVCFSPGAS